MPESTVTRLSRPLEPIPTGETPVIDPLPGLQAVAFDIYGTLFVSAAGELHLTDDADRSQPFRDAFQATGVETDHRFTDWNQRLLDIIHEQRDSDIRAGEPFPEVDIREVWRDLLEEMRLEELHTRDVTRDWIEQIALEYECRVNPVWPMPDLESTLRALRSRDLHLGLVSNAQFFTLALFGAFLHQSLAELGFADDLQFYSFEHRVAKPSTHLYELLVENLAAHDVEPEQVLYIGNDIRNDIWPAQQVGLRTALYAADKRSLRWRREDHGLRAIRPDRVITALPQVLDIVGHD